MSDLRTAAQQALEALEKVGLRADARRGCDEAVGILRAALAQQAEPVQDQRCRAEPRSDGDFVCDCKIGDCLGRSAALAQQDEPVEPVATLIAQRGVLLEALKEVVPLLEEVLEITDDPEPGSIGHKARAAIKAMEKTK